MKLSEIQSVAEAWSQKYKNSIDCNHPKGFSQRNHCAGKIKHAKDTVVKEDFPQPGVSSGAAHNHMVDANPGRTIEHNMHSSNDLGTFKLKLSGKVKT